MTDYNKYSSGSYVEKRGEFESTVQPSFTKTRSGTAFNLSRPAFKSGTILKQPKLTDSIILEKREGLGNKDITRSNFISPPIKGREVLSFERLQAQDIETGGIKVQLGDKTIEKLFKIQVDDPTDKKWVDEKNRRMALGETLEQIKNNPPLGRPQRKVSKMTNFGAQGLSIDDKIEQLKRATEQGQAESKRDMAQLIANAALLVSNVQGLQLLSQAAINDLRATILRLNIPKNYRAMGFQHRFFILQQYKQQAGMINLFLLSNLEQIQPPRNFQAPIISFTLGMGASNTINIADLGQQLRKTDARPGRILDLQTRSIYHFDDAVNAVNQGVDDGKLNGQNAPTEAPNNGQWLVNVRPTWDYYNSTTGQLNVSANLQTQGGPTPIPYPVS